MSTITFKTGSNINLGALERFAGVNSRKGRDTIVLSGETIASGGKLNCLATKLTRSSAALEANNRVRAELLISLGKAFGVEEAKMYKKAGDSYIFKADFLKQLEQTLGSTIKIKNFGIDMKNGGEVTSGKPLTERRITAIFNKVAGMSGKRVDQLRSEAYTFNNKNDLKTEINELLKKSVGESSFCYYFNPLTQRRIAFESKQLSESDHYNAIHDNLENTSLSPEEKDELLSQSSSAILNELTPQKTWINAAIARFVTTFNKRHDEFRIHNIEIDNPKIEKALIKFFKESTAQLMKCRTPYQVRAFETATLNKCKSLLAKFSSDDQDSFKDNYFEYGLTAQEVDTDEEEDIDQY